MIVEKQVKIQRPYNFRGLAHMYCVVGKCNVVKHLNVHVDYIPSHGDYPAWFRHLVINLNVKIFCDNTACRDSCLTKAR